MNQDNEFTPFRTLLFLVRTPLASTGRAIPADHTLVVEGFKIGTDTGRIGTHAQVVTLTHPSPRPSLRWRGEGE